MYLPEDYSIQMFLHCARYYGTFYGIALAGEGESVVVGLGLVDLFLGTLIVSVSVIRSISVL